MDFILEKSERFQIGDDRRKLSMIDRIRIENLNYLHDQQFLKIIINNKNMIQPFLTRLAFPRPRSGLSLRASHACVVMLNEF